MTEELYTDVKNDFIAVLRTIYREGLSDAPPISAFVAMTAVR
jgi:hypothetical protein